MYLIQCKPTSDCADFFRREWSEQLPDRVHLVRLLSGVENARARVPVDLDFLPLVSRLADVHFRVDGFANAG